MGSTGVEWGRVFDVLEGRGCKGYRGNAGHRQGGAGRKRAIQACQWIQKLPSRGWLTRACRPDAERCALGA